MIGSEVEVGTATGKVFIFPLLRTSRIKLSQLSGGCDVLTVLVDSYCLPHSHLCSPIFRFFQITLQFFTIIQPFQIDLNKTFKQSQQLLFHQ